MKKVKKTLGMILVLLFFMAMMAAEGIVNAVMG